MTASRWPTGIQAATSVTFDHLGEACDIGRGRWRESDGLGHHFTVYDVLPKLLSMLDDLGVSATFFVEAFNVRFYSDTFHEIADRGHELAVHGWVHEAWNHLTPADELRLLEQCKAEFASIGLDVRGIRPPGGFVSPSTMLLLERCGYSYASPAAKRAAVLAEGAVVPFVWPGVDAYYYGQTTRGLRKSLGDSEEPLSEDVLHRSMVALLNGTFTAGNYTALDFHPYLTTDDLRLSALRSVIEAVANDSSVWVAPCAEIEAWMRQNRDQFAEDPDFDTADWH